MAEADPADRSMEMGKARPVLRAAELLAPLAGAVSLILACLIISPKKPYWNDELYSWYFVSDPSFSHMWRAFYDAINNTPGLYFLTGWLWAKLFGAAELSLRLFSSLGFGVAMALLWAALRRVYGFWPSTIGTLLVLLTSDVVLTQNAEARMYGLFLALCAAATYQYVRLDTAERHGFRQLAGLALVHAGIVHTHLFGLFYSGALLAAVAVSDLIRQRPRKGVYAAIIVGQASFLLYLPAFFVQSQAGKPRAWLPVPSLGDLIDLVGLSTHAFANALFILALILILILVHVLNDHPVRLDGGHETAKAPRERALLILAFAFLAVAPATWLISRLVKPIFYDRYLIPTTIGYAIFVAHTVSRYVDGRSGSVRSIARAEGGVAAGRHLLSRILLAAVPLMLLAYPLWDARNRPARSVPGAMDKEFGHADLPIVAQMSWWFLERSYYASDRDRYYFIVDEQAALGKESGLFGAQEYKHMLAFKRQYPERLGHRILTGDAFLDRFDRFLVLDHYPYVERCPERVWGLNGGKIHCPQWVEMRLLNNPGFRVTELGHVGNEAYLLVERVGPRGADPQ